MKFIPTLEILGINNWPFPIGTDVESYTQYRHSYSSLNKSAYTRLCSTLANDIQEMKSPQLRNTSKLVMINMGVYETIKRESNWGHGLKPISFVKSSVQVAGVRQMTAMIPFKPWLLARHHPEGAYSSRLFISHPQCSEIYPLLS